MSPHEQRERRVPVTPPAAEALEPLLAAYVAACRDVFGEERLVAIVLHGSVVKAGHIPGYSDVDVVVFLTPDCFDDYGLRRELAFAIQERTAALDWERAGVSYFQAFYYDPHTMPAWWTGPVPGAYRMLWGEMPPELMAAPERLRQQGERLLREELPRIITASLSSFADSMGVALPRRVRLLGTFVNPAMFALVALESADPLEVWARPKFDALDALEARHPEAGAAVRRFFELAPAVVANAQKAAPGDARAAFRAGIDALIAIHRAAEPQRG